MIFVDLHLYTGEKEKSELTLFRKYASNINYVYFLSSAINSIFVQHAGFEKDFTEGNTRFIVRKSPAFRFFSFLKLFYNIRRFKPQVVMLHGMITPGYIILAASIFGPRVKILVQNHAEQPFNGFRSILQRMAGKRIAGYLFVSEKQAKPWLEKGVIKSSKQVFEVMEGSTVFKLHDKILAKNKLGYSENMLFIWVGRLDNNKDPLTVLRAFSRYRKINASAVLIMFYGSDKLYKSVQDTIQELQMTDYVKLYGRVAHEELEQYYNASDYFLLGSHHEGSGYALCEAMACACVPVVTRIPSFEQMLDNGACGYLFEPGDESELYEVLESLNKEQLDEKKQRVLEKFNNDLSFQAIGKRISEIVMNVS